MAIKIWISLAISENVGWQSLRGAAPPPDERARKFLPPATIFSARGWCCDSSTASSREVVGGSQLSKSSQLSSLFGVDLP